MTGQLLACIDEAVRNMDASMATAMGGSNTQLTAANTNLGSVISLNTAGNANTSQLHTDLSAIITYVDGLETLVTNNNALVTTTNTKLDGVIAAVNAMWTNRVPADALVYNASLSLLANPTVLAAPGVVYAVMSSGNMTIRDNTTDKIQVPGGIFSVLPVPMVCVTSIKLFAVVASNTTVWYKAS